jgi:hypothetical protein
VRRLAFRPLVFRIIVLLVVINAAAGIIVIVAGSGKVGSTEAHVLETTGLLSLAALLLLPCALSYEAGRPGALPALPWLAASSIVAGFGLAVYLVWADPVDDTPRKVAASLCVSGAGLAHVCLLSLARMGRGHAWLQLLASGLTLLLAAILIGAFWTDLDDGGFEDWKVRSFAVVAILAAASSLLVPVVGRMASGGPAARRRPRYCPNCGSALDGAVDACPACGSRFRVEFVEPERPAGDSASVRTNADASP